MSPRRRSALRSTILVLLACLATAGCGGAGTTPLNEPAHYPWYARGANLPPGGREFAGLARWGASEGRHASASMFWGWLAHMDAASLPQRRWGLVNAAEQLQFANLGVEALAKYELIDWVLYGDLRIDQQLMLAAMDNALALATQFNRQEKVRRFQEMRQAIASLTPRPSPLRTLAGPRSHPISPDYDPPESVGAFELETDDVSAHNDNERIFHYEAPDPGREKSRFGATVNFNDGEPVDFDYHARWAVFDDAAMSLRSGGLRREPFRVPVGAGRFAPAELITHHLVLRIKQDVTKTRFRAVIRLSPYLVTVSVQADEVDARKVRGRLIDFIQRYPWSSVPPAS